MHSQENSAFPSPQSGNYIESGFISCILLPPLAAQQKTLHDPKSRSHYKQKQKQKKQDDKSKLKSRENQKFTQAKMSSKLFKSELNLVFSTF